MATAAHQLTPEEASANSGTRNDRRPLCRRFRRRHAADRWSVYLCRPRSPATISRPSPTFPAEIRAPQGTLFGVSAFQINFGSTEIDTAGDQPDVLIAMNPAALKTNVDALKPGGLIIADEGEFNERNLDKAKYAANPLDDDSLAKWQLLKLNISQLTIDAVKPFGLGNKEALRCKNMWTLGLALWMFDRDRQPLIDWLKAKFAKAPDLAEANIAALNAGHAYGETAELGAMGSSSVMSPRHRPSPASTARSPAPSRFRSGSSRARSWPSAADVLRRLSDHARLGDPAPSGAAQGIWRHHLPGRGRDRRDRLGAIGASYAGSLGVTSSSGPGIALKGEAMGLAIMTELPLIIVNSQRGGPSTGLPTKTEQSDLYQAVYGRNGDAPMPVLAARSAADCFDVAIEAVRIATQYMTPVMLLTDGYIANAAEPWKVPDMSGYAPFPVAFHDRAAGRGREVPALCARREAQAPLGQARHAWPAPPHRRDREGARAPATSIIRRRTTRR
jgi:2-oxoglutarate ferredoxin oxidoreductase subunit alpha